MFKAYHKQCEASIDFLEGHTKPFISFCLPQKNPLFHLSVVQSGFYDLVVSWRAGGCGDDIEALFSNSQIKYSIKLNSI